jgi:dihydroorotate dehydrogenase (NAD+) catalytic subunit
MTNNPLQTEFCGMRLASPIVLLSGCVGFGEEYTRVEGFSNADVGAVCLKGTTGGARLGNPPHRVYETPDGMLNAIGLQNPGVDTVVDEVLPGLDFSETRFIANVSGSTVEEYERVTKRFDDSDIDAIEINISCPNVKEGGVAFGNDPDMSARVVAACRAQTAKIDTTTRKPIIGNVQGGLSGPAIKPIALLKVHQVYQVAKKHNVPIIGQGGITTVSDAIEFMIAGASAIGVGTALFYESVAELTGSLQL